MINKSPAWPARQRGLLFPKPLKNLRDSSDYLFEADTDSGKPDAIGEKLTVERKIRRLVISLTKSNEGKISICPQVS